MKANALALLATLSVLAFAPPVSAQDFTITQAVVLQSLDSWLAKSPREPS